MTPNEQYRAALAQTGTTATKAPGTTSATSAGKRGGKGAPSASGGKAHGVANAALKGAAYCAPTRPAILSYTPSPFDGGGYRVVVNHVTEELLTELLQRINQR